MSGPIDLRLGRWEDALAHVEMVDAVITDPPYGQRTHSGHDASAHGHRGQGHDGSSRRELVYDYWSTGDVDAFVEFWSPRTRGWFVAFSCFDLAPAWGTALARAGRYTFTPVLCVIPGMTCRLGGDGPGSWAVYVTVARPRRAEFVGWGALPGAYIVKRGSESRHIGGKPLDVMRALVRDYTRPGDLICDPCAGFATTALAAAGLGRRFVGSEVDPETHAKAMRRIAGGVQVEMFA